MKSMARSIATLSQTVLLVIGDIPNWTASGRRLPKGKGIVFVDYRDLTPQTVHIHQPDVVVSGLFGNGFDALDIATVLEKAGFKGRYRVIADRIPKPGLVRTEVRHVAPHVNFDVINLRGELDGLV